MDRLKNTLYAAAMVGLAAAVAFVALVFIGGALAIAGIVLVAMILIGGIMSLLGKSPRRRKADEPLTVFYTRVDDDNRNGRR